MNQQLNGEVTGSTIMHKVMIITDGEGIMHLYKAKNPVNLRAYSLKSVEKKKISPKIVPLQFTVENTSEKEYNNISTQSYYQSRKKPI